MSFYSGNLFSPKKFVGFENYIKLFTQYPFNERLLGAFINNVKYFSIVCILLISTSLILALILTKKFRGSEFFRIIYFIPTTISVLITGFLFNLMLNPVWGLLDKILRVLNLEILIRPWLGDPKTIIPVIAIVTVWQYIGIPLVLFTAGISGINKEIFEAARIDGVSEIGLVKNIIMPLLKPVTGIVFILTFITIFTQFDVVYAIATSFGNPNYSADVFSTFFYRTIYGSHGSISDPGLGTAIATIMFIVVLVGVTIWLLIFRRSEE